MTLLTPMRSTACVVVLLSASAANADVSAAEVWADLKETLSVYGEDGLSIGSEKMDGDTLTVSNIIMKQEDDITKVTQSIGELTFTELGDGTVSIGFPSSYPIAIEPQTGNIITISAQQAGLRMIVGGIVGEMKYDMSADKYGFIVDEIIDDGKVVKSDIRVTFNNVVGSYTTKTDELLAIDYDLAAGSLDFLVDVIPPETAGDYFTLSGKIDALKAQADIVMPLASSSDDPADMFANGFAMKGGYAFGSGNYIFDMKAEGEQTSGTISTSAGSLNGSMDDKAMSYDNLTNDIAISLSGGSLPFPVEASIAQYGLGFDMPLGKTEEASDFGLRVNLTDLAVNDMIWLLADPTGALPHDPATLLLDMSGKAKLFFDLFDLEQAEAMAMAAVPGELNEVTLNNMRLSVAGADVTGTGGFTFDNTDLETFAGMPRPAGDVTVNIKGANALIDSLVKMGMLPEDQAMMGRMMMGMFARTVGDDELTSKIEINK